MAYVYCPNVRCFAKADSIPGDSWRFVRTGPSNCTKCHHAFLLGRQYHRGNVTRKVTFDDGGNPDGRPTKWARHRSADPALGAKDPKRQTAGPKDADGAPSERVRFIPAESGAIRKWLLQQHKDDSNAEIMAAINSVAPQVPLTVEELREQSNEKLLKAKKKQAHEARKYDDMYKASIKMANELLEYNKAVSAQRDSVTQSKAECEKAQLEYDEHHAKPDVTMAGANDNDNAATQLTLDGIITKELSEQRIADDVPEHLRGKLLGFVKGLLKAPDLVQMVRSASQGGQQHQQQQQDHQQQQVHQQVGAQQQVSHQQQGEEHQQQQGARGSVSVQQPPAHLPSPQSAPVTAAAATPAPLASQQLVTTSDNGNMDTKSARQRDDDDSSTDDEIRQENKRLMLDVVKDDAEVADAQTLTNATALAEDLARQAAAASGDQIIAADGSRV